MITNILINPIQELKDACLKEKGDYVHFRMLLAGGIACSSKRIMYFEELNTFNVINEIDESYQDDLNEIQLGNETMIVMAIERGIVANYAAQLSRVGLDESEWLRRLAKN